MAATPTQMNFTPPHLQLQANLDCKKAQTGQLHGSLPAEHQSLGLGQTFSMSLIPSLQEKLADAVLVSACGFVADHLEVLYDLDIEAQHRADHHGLKFDRTTCVNDNAHVMTALAKRVVAAAQA